MSGPVLTIGTVAFDDIITPYGRQDGILGGSATHFAMAARFKYPVEIIAPIGDDFPPKYLKFLSRKNIDVSSLSRISGKSFHWKGSYDKTFADARTIKTELGVLAGFVPSLTKTQVRRDYCFLANIDPEVQLHIINKLKGPRVLASDTMNFWIESARKNLIKTFRAVDVLFINETEIKQLAEERVLLKAVNNVSRMGVETVVVKKGEHGVFLFHKGRFSFAPAYPLERIVDPTGAGDSFAGAFMSFIAASGRRLSSDLLKQALIYSCVMASFTVEGFGSSVLDRLSVSGINARLRKYKSMLITC